MKKEIKEVIEQCNVETIEEVTELLKATADRGHTKIACLLNEKPWTEWNPFIISQIPSAIKWKPILTSVIWTEEGKKFEITGEDFVDPETFVHKDFDPTIYKLEEVRVDGRTKTFRIERIVPIDKEQEFLDKIKNGINLTEKEIKEIYEEIGTEVDEYNEGEGRWEIYMKTIVLLKDEYVAIDWNKGKTEMQEDSFYEQPYIVEKKVEMVTIERVSWNKK